MKRWIMGKNTLEELFKVSPQRLIQVYSSKRNDPLVNALNKKNIKVNFVSKHKLSSLVHSESHQGFVAEVKERDFLSLKQFLDTPLQKSLVVMCDSITDPQNFGTILRACECFSVDAVIFSKNRNVSITPTVSKTSVGGSELVPLIPVSNLAETLKAFQKNGYLGVAANCGKENLYSFSFPEKTLLILGSEGKGIQPLLLKKADVQLEIPMHGSIDSLNVSQATAVLLSHWRKSI